MLLLMMMTLLLPIGPTAADSPGTEYIQMKFGSGGQWFKFSTGASVLSSSSVLMGKLTRAELYGGRFVHDAHLFPLQPSQARTDRNAFVIKPKDCQSTVRQPAVHVKSTIGDMSDL